MRGTTRLPTAIACAAAVFAASPPAAGTADCEVSYDSASFCYIDCDTGRDYIVFGKIAVETSPGYYTTQGVGVCVFEMDDSYNRGSYSDAAWASMYNGKDYQVYGDGFAATGSKDFIRLASVSTWEWCRTSNWPSQPGVLVNGNLPYYGGWGDHDTYLFYGDKGDDDLRLCSSVSTFDATTCEYGGVADGRDDNDYVYGSGRPYSIWGGSGNDSLYAGTEADGSMHGGSGTDTLYGNSGSQEIHGDEGNDYLYGFDGLDELYGDGDYDRCNGGPPGGFLSDFCDCEEESYCEY